MTPRTHIRAPLRPGAICLQRPKGCAWAGSPEDATCPTCRRRWLRRVRPIEVGQVWRKREEHLLLTALVVDVDGPHVALEIDNGRRRRTTGYDLRARWAPVEDR